MRQLTVVLFLLLILIRPDFSSSVSALQEQLSSDESAMVKVVSYKWSRDRQQVDSSHDA